MQLSEQFPDPVSGIMTSIKSLAKTYNLAKSTIQYRIRHAIPINAPIAKSGGNSSTMKSSWIRRKQEMADFIANMQKSKR